MVSSYTLDTVWDKLNAGFNKTKMHTVKGAIPDETPCEADVSPWMLFSVQHRQKHLALLPVSAWSPDSWKALTIVSSALPGSLSCIGFSSRGSSCLYVGGCESVIHPEVIPAVPKHHLILPRSCVHTHIHSSGNDSKSKLGCTILMMFTGLG